MPRYYTYKKQVALKPGQTLGYRRGKGYYAKGRVRVAKSILLREKLVRTELAATKLGIVEQGGNNHGPWIRKFLAETGLPEGYPWCAAFQSYEIHSAAGKKLPIESASVAAIYETGRANGWLVDRPLRGDLFCVNWNGPGPPYADHVGLVVKVLSIAGLYWVLETVEGNTSSGRAGSQGDGDGVYVRRRVFRKNQVAFVRIPGKVKP